MITHGFTGTYDNLLQIDAKINEFLSLFPGSQIENLSISKWGDGKISASILIKEGPSEAEMYMDAYAIDDSNF